MTLNRRRFLTVAAGAAGAAAMPAAARGAWIARVNIFVEVAVSRHCRGASAQHRKRNPYECMHRRYTASAE